MEKLSKIARVLDAIARIVFWLCVAGVALCVAALVMVIRGGAGVLGENYGITTIAVSGAGLGSISLTFLDVFRMHREMIGPLTVVNLAYIVLCFVFTFGVLRVVRSILRPMKGGSVFDVAVSRRLRGLAFTVLIGGGLLSGFDCFRQHLLVGTYDLSELFDGKWIFTFTENYRIDGTFLLVFAILLLLSYVFRYGEELQTLSDETL